MEHNSPMRKSLVIAGSICMLASLVGLAIALVDNVPTAADGVTARETWITIGTVYSPPLIFLAVYALCLGLALRRSWPGVLGTIGIMVLSTISDLSVPGDWSSTWDAFMQHFNAVAVFSVMVLLLVNALVVILGATALLQQWRWRTSPQTA